MKKEFIGVAIEHYNKIRPMLVYVPAYRYSDALAVTQRVLWQGDAVYPIRTSFTITHIPTGVAVLNTSEYGRFKTPSLALLACDAITSLTNWLDVTVENAPSLGLSSVIRARYDAVARAGPRWRIALATQRLTGTDYEVIPE